MYTVMEYIEGENFNELLKKQKNFSQAQIIKWSKQLCEVLIYLHERQKPIIHSDIKPANIMLTPEDNICLIDFNISLIFNNGISALGRTHGYSAPEQYMNKVSKLSDIYSLGAVMYHLATGEMPSRDKSIEDFDLKLSRKFKNIIKKAMSQVPEKRFKSAEDMLKALNEINKSGLLKKSKNIFLEILVIILFAGILGNRDSRVKNEKDYYFKCIEGINNIEYEGNLTKELLKQRAEIYYRLGCITDKREYILKSAADFEELLEEEYINFDNINNAASLYCSIGKFEKAEEILNKYADELKDYRIYIQLAFLYAQQEESKEKLYRNYSKVKQNYELALKYSEKAVDFQLEKLKIIIKELEEKEWL